MLKVSFRDVVFRALRAEGISVNVHFIQFIYILSIEDGFGTHAGIVPSQKQHIHLSLPIFPRMTPADVSR